MEHAGPLSPVQLAQNKIKTYRSPPYQAPEPHPITKEIKSWTHIQDTIARTINLIVRNGPGKKNGPHPL